MQKLTSFLLKVGIMLWLGAFAFPTLAGPGFITTWITTDGSITIPTTGGGGFNYTVTWANLTNPSAPGNAGGGTLTGQTGSATFSGLNNGDTYQVEITGAFPNISFNNGTQKTKIRTIAQWGNIAWTYMGNAFYGCSNLTYTATDAPNLSGVTFLGYMFSGASSFNGDLSSWNVGNVTNTFGMFLNATSFNGNLSSWNMSNVTSAANMFQNASSFNSDLSGWNVGKLTGAAYMFSGATNFNSDLSGWDVSKVTSMTGMFMNATNFNSNLSNWNVSNVTAMNLMFSNATSFNSDLSNWDVSNVTSTFQMFYNASSFNSDLSNWNVGKATNIGGMFNRASAFNSDLSRWNVSSVTNMPLVFYFATSFNSDLSDWDMSKATNVGDMLSNCGMSPGNYDKTLIGWATQTLKPSLNLGATGMKYCTAEAARQSIITTYGWTFTGDSKNCAGVAACSTLVASIENMSCETGTGTLLATGTGGNPGYTYTWSNAADTAYIAGLANGTYSVVIEDSYGCVDSASYALTIHSPISVSISGTNPTCAGDDGTLQATVTGGDGSYSYLWSYVPLDTAYITDLSAGTYSVVVSDLTGCTDSAAYTLSNPSSPSITIVNSYGELSWVSIGGTSILRFRADTTSAWSTVQTLTGVAQGDSLHYTATACGYYQVEETNGVCVNVLSNIIARPAATLINDASFTTQTSIFNQDGFSYYRVKANAVPSFVPSNIPVNFKTYDNGNLVMDQTITMAQAKAVGVVEAFYASCVIYSIVVEFTYDCTTYRRTSTAKSPILNINIGRLGRKVRHNPDTLDVKWSLNATEISNFGTSVGSYEVLVTKADNFGNISGTEMLAGTITDPTQINKREARLTTLGLRNIGLLGGTESVADVSLRIRIKAVMANPACQVAFSNVHYEYRCVAFTFMTGCATTSSFAARLSLTASQEEGAAADWGISAYPNPTEGTFTLSIPEHVLAQKDLQLEIMNSAGQTVFSTALGSESPRQFDFSGKPTGMYYVRIVGQNGVHTTKLVLE